MVGGRGKMEDHLKVMRLWLLGWHWMGVLVMKTLHLQTSGCCLHHWLLYYYLGQRQHLQVLERAYISPLLSASGEFASAVEPSAPPGVLPGLVALGAVPAALVSWMPAAAQDWSSHGVEAHREMM